MRIEFDDKDLRRLYEDRTFRLRQFGPDITKQYRKAIGVVVAARDERDIRALKSLRLEKLRGDRDGQHSIRLNDQWRLILEFRQDDQGRVVVIVSISDYH